MKNKSYEFSQKGPNRPMRGPGAHRMRIVEKPKDFKGTWIKLLKYCEKLIKENGCNTIQMTSNKNRVYAHMLYAKNLFEPIDTILLKKDI